MKRAIVLAAAAFVLGGCSSYREVPRADLVPDRSFEKSRVATIDGFEYRFVRAEVVADTLFGFYQVTEERSGPKGEVWFEDALRRHAIPLSSVARVDLVRKDPMRTALWGASIAAAGYFLVTLVDETTGEPSDGGGGGKPPIKP
jgi:hypothetical protein